MAFDRGRAKRQAGLEVSSPDVERAILAAVEFIEAEAAEHAAQVKADAAQKRYKRAIRGLTKHETDDVWEAAQARAFNGGDDV